MSEFGRILVSLGVLLVVIGALLIVLGRLNLPLGRLPGDFRWKGTGWSVSFPLMTSVLLSLALTLILWIVNHFRR